MVKAVLQRDKNKIYKLFGRMDFFQDEEEDIKTLKKKYDIKRISVFDHWLNDEEYLNAIMNYSEKFRDINVEKQYTNYEQLFLNFYSYLYNNTIVYGRLYCNRSRGGFVTFDTEQEYLSHVLLSIREQLFLEIVLPEYRVVIDGNYDLTHILLTKKDYLEGLEAISKIAKAHGLYIL
ncbi:MAG: hypothetical protein LN590_01230 [Rickettsia endosymbiont of Glossina mortisans submortisans]|nr:hypothetical protein [Rickettsia endosymbiont of Glossina mortisans submortisans]